MGRIKVYRKCFTLIELLIAVTIITVIMLSIYSAFNTGILSYKKIDSSFELYQSVRTVFNRLEIDLRNSFAYTSTDSYFRGSSWALDFFNISDIYDKDTVYSNICRVKYVFQEQTLKRISYILILALDENSNPEAEELTGRVKDIKFQYAYKSDNAKEPYVWQDIWPKDDTQKKQLPLAVKIKLSLIDKDKSRESVLEFTKVIALTQESAMGVLDTEK